MYWNVTVEMGEEPITEDRASALMDGLVDYHPAVGSGYRNRPRITITLAAESLRHAVGTGVLLVEATSQSQATHVEAMTTDEFDVREGFLPIPALISATDAGDFLGVSRVRVNQMIDEGRFPTAQKVGNGYVIPAEAVWSNGRMHTMIGWTGIEIAQEHHRQVVDPFLDALRSVGPMAAYNAFLAVERGEVANSPLADAWREAERDALYSLAMLGYDISGAGFTAQRTGTRVGSGFPTF